MFTFLSLAVKVIQLEFILLSGMDPPFEREASRPAIYTPHLAKDSQDLPCNSSFVAIEPDFNILTYFLLNVLIYKLGIISTSMLYGLYILYQHNVLYLNDSTNMSLTSPISMCHKL